MNSYAMSIETSSSKPYVDLAEYDLQTMEQMAEHKAPLYWCLDGWWRKISPSRLQHIVELTKDYQKWKIRRPWVQSPGKGLSVHLNSTSTPRATAEALQALPRLPYRTPQTPQSPPRSGG